MPAPCGCSPCLWQWCPCLLGRALKAGCWWVSAGCRAGPEGVVGLPLAHVCYRPRPVRAPGPTLVWEQAGISRAGSWLSVTHQPPVFACQQLPSSASALGFLSARDGLEGTVLSNNLFFCWISLSQKTHKPKQKKQTSFSNLPITLTFVFQLC